MESLIRVPLQFTTSPGSITVRISASTDPPPQRAGGLRVGQVDFEDTSHYLSPVWVTCSVTDTGRGLSAEEMRILFERFAQVRPKTDQVRTDISLRLLISHRPDFLQYGGSGLGLFVSKQVRDWLCDPPWIIFLTNDSPAHRASSRVHRGEFEPGKSELLGHSFFCRKPDIVVAFSRAAASRSPSRRSGEHPACRRRTTFLRLRRLDRWARTRRSEACFFPPREANLV